MSGLGQRLLARLERSVDPFDLEMSSARMNANLGRAVHVSSALYASLVPAVIRVDAAAMTGADESGFLTLVPGANPLDSKEAVNKDKTHEVKPLGLLPFSLSMVRPIPTPSAKPRPNPQATLADVSQPTLLNADLLIQPSKYRFFSSFRRQRACQHLAGRRRTSPGSVAFHSLNFYLKAKLTSFFSFFKYTLRIPKISPVF